MVPLILSWLTLAVQDDAALHDCLQSADRHGVDQLMTIAWCPRGLGNCSYIFLAYRVAAAALGRCLTETCKLTRISPLSSGFDKHNELGDQC